MAVGNVCYAVLDEADRMLDMGFETQVREIVEGRNMGELYHPSLKVYSC